VGLQVAEEPRLQQRRHQGMKIGEGGGVEAIVQSMGWHSWSEVVQEWVCWTLGNLAVNNADINVKIGGGGGVEAIVQTMSGHPGSEGVQREGCGSLWTLGQSNRDKTGTYSNASRGLVRRRLCIVL
jgi:hypothetical protein